METQENEKKSKDLLKAVGENPIGVHFMSRATETIQPIMSS
jgi:hypothetical protein